MDCDYDESKKKSARDEINEMSRRRKGGRNKKSLFAEKLQAKKPVFDPSQYANYEEYLEEYYKLDFEDIIGDQPVRFKYRSVLANDFGLDTEEVRVKICICLSSLLNQMHVFWFLQLRFLLLAIRNSNSGAQSRRCHNTERTMKSLKTCTPSKAAREMSTSKRKSYRHFLPSEFYNKKVKGCTKCQIVHLFSRNSEELLVEDQEKDRKKRRRAQGKEDNPYPKALA